jgi:hypothetical protein
MKITLMENKLDKTCAICPSLFTEHGYGWCLERDQRIDAQQETMMTSIHSSLLDQRSQTHTLIDRQISQAGKNSSVPEHVSYPLTNPSALIDLPASNFAPQSPIPKIPQTL